MISTAIILGSTRPGRNGEAVAKWVYEIAKAVSTNKGSNLFQDTNTSIDKNAPIKRLIRPL